MIQILIGVTILAVIKKIFNTGWVGSVLILLLACFIFFFYLVYNNYLPALADL